MIKLENTEVLGWEHAIRGMRNPMNSWEKSDSGIGCSVDFVDRICAECDRSTPCVMEQKVVLGPNDHDLMMRLAKGGPVHAKYRRMITVYVDITAPLYWWKEFDTYKVGTVANSCSTMHKIAAKEFTLEDFSCEHLFGNEDMLKWDERTDIAKDHALAAVNVDGDWCYFSPKGYIQMTCNMLNRFRQLYLETKDKKYWWQMIQLLPSSYNQKWTVMLNYEVLTGIYPSRKNHKLDEWHTFCDWIEDLPYSEIIVGERSDDTGMTDEEKDKLFEEINKILKTKYPKLDSDTLQVIHEKAEEILEEGKNIDWKKANPKFYPEDQRFGALDAISLDKKTGVVHEIPSFDIDKFPQDADAVTLVPGMEVKDEANMRWVAACDLCNEHGCGDSDEETCKKCRFYQYSKWAKEENVGPNDGLNKHFGGYEE